MEEFTLETWDPEGEDYNRTTYSYNSRTGRFDKDPNGSIILYRADPRVHGELASGADAIYWDKELGTTYWIDPNTGKAVEIEDSTIKNATALDFWDKTMHPFLTDDTLNTVAEYVNEIIIANNARKLQEEQAKDEAREQEQAAALGGKDRVDLISVTPTEEEASAVASKIASESKSADMRLQNLIDAEEANLTNTTSTPAEKTVYYNYGPEEIDLKYYLHNLGTNLQNYLNSQNWSTAQKNAFKKAYETYKAGLTEQLITESGRFKTDDAGILIDSQGLLDGKNDHVFIDELGNTYNSLDEITDKKLRKTAIEFSPNDEVANYFNTIGQAVVGAGKTKKGASEAKGTFDPNNNGFVKYWAEKVNPAGGEVDMAPYWQLDAVGADGKRGRTNRTKYLSYQLQQYIKNINSSNYNFEGTPFKTKENYIKKIQQAITNLNNGWDDSDPASLLAIGVTSEFYNVLMSDKADPMASAEDEAAAKTEEEAKRKSEAESSYISKTEDKYKEYAADTKHYTGNNKLSYVPDSNFEIPEASDQGATDAYKGRIHRALTNFGFSNATGTPGSDTYNAAMGTNLDILWKKVKLSLYNGATSIEINGKTTNLSEVLPVIIPFAIAKGDFLESTDSSGNPMLLGTDIDGLYGTVLCLQDNKLFYDWYYNHQDSKTCKAVQTNFENKYAALSKSTSDKPKYSFSAKQGGIIKKFAEGGAPEAPATETPDANSSPEEIAAYIEKLAQGESQSEETPTTPTKRQFSSGKELMDSLYAPDQAKAKERGMSYERYYAKLRAPLGAKTELHPENGIFKAEDYARMGAIVADIASLVLDPVSGAAVGVGSTASNFVADWLDDTVTTAEMWKNLGMNLGMDALGIIPIIGDAAGTGGKLVKSIKMIAPKLMYGLTAYGILGTLKNGPNILESLQKITSDEKLTVGDYQNIAQAITAVAGLNSGLRSTVAKKFAKKNAKVEDSIGIGLRKQGSDTKQDYIFSGESAKKIKELVANNDTKKLNEYIKSLEGFSDYTVNTNLSSMPIGTRLPVGRSVGDDGKKHWGILSPFSIERKIDIFEIYDPKKLNGHSYATKNLLNTGRQNAVSADRRFGDADLISEVDLEKLAKDQLKAKAEEMGAVHATESAHAAKKRIETDLNGILDADGNITKKGLKKQRDEINATIAQKEAERDAILARADAAEKAYLDLRNKKYEGLDLKDPDNRALALLDLEDTLKKKLDALKKASTSSEQANLKKEIDDLNTEKQIIENWDDQLNTFQDTWSKLLDSYNFTNRSIVDPIQTRNKLLQRIDFLEEQLAFLNNPTRKSKKTLALYDLFNNGQTFTVSYGNGRTKEIDNETVQRILKSLGLFKQGGNLIRRAVMAASGVLLIAPDNSWYDQVFSNYKQTILDRIHANRDYYKKINDMQTAHHKIYIEAGGADRTWATTAHQGIDNSVGNYQKIYDEEQFNDLGINPNFGTRYGYASGTKRTSGDNSTRHYKYDNLYSSITDDRRVLGRSGDWTDDQIRDFNTELKKKLLEMYLGDGGYYYIRELGSGTPLLSTGLALDLNKLEIPEGRSGGSEDDPNNSNKKGSKFNWAALASNLPDPMVYLRYKILDNNNRRIARHAMANEKPFYLNPQLDYTFVHSDLRAENQGAQAQADLVRRGNHAVTSDGAAQMAYLKELWQQGLQYKEAGLLLSDKTYRETQKEDQAQRLTNHTAEHKVAEANRLAAHQSEANRAKIWSAYLTKRGNVQDTLLSKFEYDREVAKKKREAATEAAKIAEMLNAVTYNPNKYGANLTSTELAAYNKMLAGTSSESLSETEKTNLIAAKGKIANVILRLQYNILGVPETEYTYDSMNRPAYGTAFSTTLSNPSSSSSSSTSSDINPDASLAKDGAKLETAKLRKRVKDADRYAKSIEKKIDSINKQLDRISKSMYGLPKLKMV